MDTKKITISNIEFEIGSFDKNDKVSRKQFMDAGFDIVSQDDVDMDMMTLEREAASKLGFSVPFFVKFQEK
jgi:hypothetical protein